MDILSKNKLKFLVSLKQKKYRDIHRIFCVEGTKAVADFISSGVSPKIIVGKQESLMVNSSLNTELYVADIQNFERLTNFSDTPDIIAYFDYFTQPSDFSVSEDEIILFCDGIQNPGNFGTIIRTAEWFGVTRIVCSQDTVDCFNPKTVQATMGSLSRVAVNYVDTDIFFKKIYALGVPVYGTFMDGSNIYEIQPDKVAVIILGNEGQGIRPEVSKYAKHKLSIPQFSKSMKPESLNVSIAASIILSEFKRRTIPNLKS